MCQVQALAHNIAVSNRKVQLTQFLWMGKAGQDLTAASVNCISRSALQTDPICRQTVLQLLKGIKSYAAVAILFATCLKPACIGPSHVTILAQVC